MGPAASSQPAATAARAVRPAAAPTTLPAPTPTAEGARDVALHYLQALQAGQWQTLWQLSHPLAQKRWPDEAAFVAFLATKFAPDGHPIVSDVAVGTPTPLPAWNDLRFTPAPLAAVALDGTLTLAKDAPLAVPPTDLTDRAELVLARDGANWKVVDGGPADLVGPVLVPSLPKRRELRLPILMYHHVAPTPTRTAAMTDYDYRLLVDLTVTPDHFAQQLDWLQAHGYQTIAPQQLMAALYDGVALPARPILLTFDDGYLDNIQYAAPALEQRHMLGTFNVITGLVGTPPNPLSYMSWDQIASMAARGMDVESHTVYHRDLGTLSAKDAEGELAGSRAALTSHLGFAPQFICYPSGEPFRSGTAAAQQRLLTIVPSTGYVAGFLDPRVASATQSSATPDELPRIRVAGEETLGQFVASVEG